MPLWELLQQLYSNEIIGLIGGGIFFGSWVLQAWETRQAGKPVVSPYFFLLRAIASLLMAFEAIRVGSFSIFIVMAATLVLILYNLRLSLKERSR
ncbi:hypothetical protein [Kiloniella sp.]|uniref:hypothetical protein n=1 Tax=Kiloniella sp. TaxID=1938587 RepID=UPI003A8ED880